jgi:hypothetical protein
MDLKKARELHFVRMQKALEEGLRAIETARTPAEADVARQRAQGRMEELNRMWEEAFGKDATVDA